MAYLTEISLAFITTVIAILLIRWQFNKDNTFDLSHMLLGDDGKVSLFRFGQLMALITSTWAFITLVQQGKLTEWFFMSYMTIWSGINLAKNILGKAQDGSASKN